MFRTLWLDLLVPFPMFSMWRLQHKGVDSLIAMRGTFLTWIHAAGLILVVLGFILSGDSDMEASMSPEAFSGGVALFGVVVLAMVMWARRRPLEVSDRDKVKTSYTSQFFLGMALSQSVYLVGFVGVFVTGSWWPILTSIPFMLAGYALIAPTEGNLWRKQQQINAAGSDFSLTQALLSSPFTMQHGAFRRGRGQDPG